MQRVTDDAPVVGDHVACAWSDEHGAQQAGGGTVVEVTAGHVTVRLDAPLGKAAASYVAFPHTSDVLGLSCRKAVP